MPSVRTRGWSPACVVCVHGGGEEGGAGRDLGVRVAGDVTVTAQGGGGWDGGGWGVCVTYGDSTRTKDPQASYVERTSGLAASRPMLLKRPCLFVYFSSTLCTCRAVHHKYVCVFGRVYVCVCAKTVHISLCHTSCLGSGRSPNSKKKNNNHNEKTKRVKKFEKEVCSVSASGVKRRNLTKLKSPRFLHWPAVGLVFFPLAPPRSTIRPHLHLQ